MIAATGAFHYEPRNGNILSIDNHPIIFIKRDADGYLILNIYLGLLQGSSFIIKNNWWILLESPEDVECPPGGHLLKVRFKGGNYFEIKFIEYPTKDQFLKSFGLDSLLNEEIKFPLLVIQLNLEIKELGISFKAQKMKNFCEINDEIIFIGYYVIINGSIETEYFTYGNDSDKTPAVLTQSDGESIIRDIVDQKIIEFDDYVYLGDIALKDFLSFIKDCISFLDFSFI